MCAGLLDLVDADDQVLDLFLILETHLLQIAALLLQHQVFLHYLFVSLLQALVATILPNLLPAFSDRYGLNRALAIHTVTLPLRGVPLLRLRELRQLIRQYNFLRVVLMIDGLAEGLPAVLL